MLDAVSSVIIVGFVWLLSRDIQARTERRHRALINKLDTLISLSESQRGILKEIAAGNDELRALDADTRAVATIELMARKLGVTK